MLQEVMPGNIMMIGSDISFLKLFQIILNGFWMFDLSVI